MQTADMFLKLPNALSVVENSTNLRKQTSTTARNLICPKTRMIVTRSTGYNCCNQMYTGPGI
jgi:hypothetical protein